MTDDERQHVRRSLSKVGKIEYSKNKTSRVSTVEVVSLECTMDDYGKIFTE
jgi:hypothetical protein